MLAAWQRALENGRGLLRGLAFVGPGGRGRGATCFSPSVTGREEDRGKLPDRASDVGQTESNTEF